MKGREIKDSKDKIFDNAKLCYPKTSVTKVVEVEKDCWIKEFVNVDGRWVKRQVKKGDYLTYGMWNELYVIDRRSFIGAYTEIKKGVAE